MPVSFTAGRLTHFGGVYLLHGFLQKLKLRTFLSEKITLEERNNHYSVSQRIFAFLYPMILGLDKIELSKLLGANGVFQYLTGLPSFPNPTTLRRFLTKNAKELLPQVKNIHDYLRKCFLKASFPRTSFWLDFDSTAKTLYGNQEGAIKGYNPSNPGKKSYHPLVCVEAHRKDCVGGELRRGNAHTASGVEKMLELTLETLPETAKNIRVRADAGFYDKDFTALLGQKKIGFSIVARMTAPLQEKVVSARYKTVDNIYSTAEFKYQPTKWKQTERFVVLREKLTEKRDAQLTLFKTTSYAYHVIVTNLRLKPYNVFEFYEDRSALERIIRTMKDDYSFAGAPTKNFDANALYAELSILAYNIVVWFKRFCFPKDWQSYTIPTLRHKILFIPGILTRTNNKPRLRLPKDCLYQDVFGFVEKKVQKIKPLA